MKVERVTGEPFSDSETEKKAINLDELANTYADSVEGNVIPRDYHIEDFKEGAYVFFKEGFLRRGHNPLPESEEVCRQLFEDFLKGKCLLNLLKCDKLGGFRNKKQV